jgi:hypothetical protein
MPGPIYDAKLCVLPVMPINFHYYAACDAKKILLSKCHCLWCQIILNWDYAAYFCCLLLAYYLSTCLFLNWAHYLLANNVGWLLCCWIEHIIWVEHIIWWLWSLLLLLLWWQIISYPVLNAKLLAGLLPQLLWWHITCSSPLLLLYSVAELSTLF